MELAICVIIVIISVIGIICESNEKEKKEKKKNIFKKNVCSISKENDLGFYQEDSQKALLIYEAKGRITICTYVSDEKVHNYSIGINDIISFDILENDSSLVSVNRGSQLGGALVGGALLGGVGAIIGGLSGSKRQDTYCKSIKIKFVFNDLKHKTDEIIFLESLYNKGYKKDSKEYKEALKETEKFYDTLCILMNKKDLPHIDITNEIISIEKENSINN